MRFLGEPTTKPLAGAMINGSDPLSVGLGFSAPANEGAGRVLSNGLKLFAPQIDSGLQPGVAEWLSFAPWGPCYWVGLGGNASSGTGWLENTSSWTAIAVKNYTVSVCAGFHDLATLGGAYRDFFSKVPGTSNRFVFQRDQTNVRAGVVIGGVGTYVTLSGFAELYKPYVFTLVVEQDTTTTFLSLYVNGVLQGTNSVGSLVIGEASGIKIVTSSNNCRVIFGGAWYWLYAMPPEMVRLQASDPFAMYRSTVMSRISGSLTAPAASLLNQINHQGLVVGRLAA